MDGPSRSSVRGNCHSRLGIIRQLLGDPRVRTWIARAADASEVLTFLLPMLLAVAFLHILVGPMPTGSVIAFAWWRSHRPSVRAVCWISGGVYLACLLFGAATALGQATPPPAIEPAADLLALVLATGGVATLTLIVLVPLGRVASGVAPALMGTITTWVGEVTKGAIAGVTVGLAAAGITSGSEPFDGRSDLGRPVLTFICLTAGVIVGGVRADSRVRARRKCARPVDDQTTPIG